MMFGDRFEFFLCLKRCFIAYMNRNQNKSKSFIFNECKTISKLHESLLLIIYYCFQTSNFVHPVIPGSPIENKEQ